MNSNAFLTTEQVLDYLQINLRTVYRLIQAGKLPALRVGRQWRFRKSDIDAWLERQQAVDSRAESPTRRVPVTSDVRAPGSSRPHVLVVDDEPDIRSVLLKTLAFAEYDVDVASDGRSALQHLRRGAYRLLITDLRMPGMDGMAVINEARRLDADLPVIIITGHSTEAAAIDAANVGVSGYLTKPFKAPKVCEMVGRALGD
jgi:excisionase family DNA binding protein